MAMQVTIRDHGAESDEAREQICDDLTQVPNGPRLKSSGSEQNGSPKVNIEQALNHQNQMTSPSAV